LELKFTIDFVHLVVEEELQFFLIVSIFFCK